MMSKVVEFPDELEGLKRYFNDKVNEKPKAMIVLTLNLDGSFEFYHTKSCYLEKVGMLENAKQDLYAKTNDLV